MRLRRLGWGLVVTGIFFACGDDDSSPTGGVTLPDAGGTVDSSRPPSSLPPDSGSDTGAPTDAGADANVDAGSVNIKPSGPLGAVDLTTATADLVLDGLVGINSDNGNIFIPGAGINNIRAPGTGVISGIGYSEVAQKTGAPKIGVYTFHSLTIKATANIVVSGSNAIAFMSAGDVAVGGTLSVSATCASAQAGPGGFAGGQPNPFVGNLPNRGGDPTNEAAGANHVCSGGGGGGAATGGSNGSFATSGAKTASLNAGATGRDSPFLTTQILAGGSGGGNVVGGTQGGASGGALEVFSKSAITVSGNISASGCGGKGASKPSATTCVGAGGGGAGGTIFFEALSVSLTSTAIVVANGGAGGGGTNGAVGFAPNGGDGSTTSATAAVGGESIATNGACDNGTNAGTAQGNVGNCTGTATVAAAGGGGQNGIIAARTQGSAMTIAAGSTVQPVADQGPIAVQ